MAMETIQRVIKKRGLELATNKTRIVNLVDGFNFLGYNIRLDAVDGTNRSDIFIHKGTWDNEVNDYQIVNNKKALLIIKPSTKSIESFKNDIKEVFLANRQTKPSKLIRILNTILRGWALSKNCWHANRTFHDLDNHIFNLCWRWIHRLHPNKNNQWKKNRYYSVVAQVWDSQ
jgi:RNA-directed DNA polymerase